MKNIATWSFLVALLVIVATLSHGKRNNMNELRFDLGENIVETAKDNGTSHFSTRDIAGYISYSLIDLPPDSSALYLRPGYEIKAQPLFGFTLYADREQDKRLLVETAALQFDTDSLKSHQLAKTFVENLIVQFKNGSWARYIDDLCPAVTGRSSYLNEAGQPEQIDACSLDPQYQISNDDWAKLMETTQTYQWLGKGVLATLTVGSRNQTNGLTYSIDLEFNDFEIKKRRSATSLALDLAHGDAQGWNSSENEKKNIASLKSRITLLEENARRRGDTVLPR